jgi:hypothetical protein
MEVLLFYYLTRCYLPAWNLQAGLLLPMLFLAPNSLVVLVCRSLCQTRAFLPERHMYVKTSFVRLACREQVTGATFGLLYASREHRSL